MQGTLRVLELVRDQNLAAGHLRGLFHIVIGRRITDANGVVVSSGITWRQLAAMLKEAKYDKELVREFVADPESLSPKDREKFWYSAVALAQVDGPEAHTQADQLAQRLTAFGLFVGPPPGGAKPPAPPARKKTDDETIEQANLSPPSPKKRKKK
jgi:hypothetical protein